MDKKIFFSTLYILKVKNSLTDSDFLLIQNKDKYLSRCQVVLSLVLCGSGGHLPGYRRKSSPLQREYMFHSERTLRVICYLSVYLTPNSIYFCKVKHVLKWYLERQTQLYAIYMLLCLVAQSLQSVKLQSIRTKHLQNTWRNTTFPKPILSKKYKNVYYKKGIIVTEFVKLYLLTVLKFTPSKSFTSCIFHTITTAMNLFYTVIQFSPENWLNSYQFCRATSAAW